MKILWFTNTPSLAADYLRINNQGGGWISSLQKWVTEIDQIQLGVAFHHDCVQKQHFMINQTQYFAIPNPDAKSRVGRFLRRWKHEIEPASILSEYLDVVNEFKPDLVHVFGSEQAFGMIVDKLQVPLIIQIQGNITVYAKKWYVGLSRSDLFRHSGYKPLLRAYGVWHDYFIFLKKAEREKEIFRKCRFFIGRTDWDRRVTSALSDNGKYFHCDELLREPFHDIVWTGIGHEKYRLFSTLKPITYKGLETVLETAAILKKKNAVKFEWIIAGVDYDDEIISIIEKVCRLKFPEQNIIFKGSLGPESLITSLMDSDCYVHPSHIENSVNSVCEAMLIGMPVIATSAGGTPSLLLDSKEGTLVQDGDPYALAGAIIEMAENPSTASLLGRNARKRALERHNPQKVISDLLGIYTSVLSEKSDTRIR